MNRQLSCPTIVVVIALCLLTAGCSQPFPTKDLFAVQAGEPKAVAGPAKPVIVRVARMTVASPYDGRNFVYKVGADKYETDYYNGFIAVPGDLLTGTLRDWLDHAGLFKAVITSTSRLTSPFCIEGNVTQMYGDYTDRTSPKAVVAARFFVIDDTGGESVLLFSKAYQASSPLKGSTPEALAAGLGADYRQILSELAADLSKLDIKEKPREESPATIPVEPAMPDIIGRGMPVR